MAADRVRFREAGRDDLPAILALLSGDDLGRGREEAPLAAYQAAVHAIAASPADRLIVGCRAIGWWPARS